MLGVASMRRWNMCCDVTFMSANPLMSLSGLPNSCVSLRKVCGVYWLKTWHSKFVARSVCVNENVGYSLKKNISAYLSLFDLKAAYSKHLAISFFRKRLTPILYTQDKVISSLLLNKCILTLFIHNIIRVNQ